MRMRGCTCGHRSVLTTSSTVVHSHEPSSGLGGGTGVTYTGHRQGVRMDGATAKTRRFGRSGAA